MAISLNQQANQQEDVDMKSVHRLLFSLWFILAFLSQGCALNTYNFSNIRLQLQISHSGSSGVAVATLDQRTVLESGKLPPTYVGVRWSAGNPFSVNTESGKPFAEDVTKSVAESLADKGFRAMPVYVSYGQTEQQTKKALLEKKAERAILILIKQWESDVLFNIGLAYSFRLMVLGANQSVVAEVSAADATTIPGSFWDPIAAAKKQIPVAFKKVLEELLNDPKIISALQ